MSLDNKSSAVAEMGDRLATIDMGRMEAAVSLSFGEAGSPSNTMSPGRGLPPYQVVSWSIQPFGHMGPRATRCSTANVQVDAQCDKLANELS